jgi:hypothetical protein
MIAINQLRLSWRTRASLNLIVRIQEWVCSRNYLAKSQSLHQSE